MPFLRGQSLRGGLFAFMYEIRGRLLVLCIEGNCLLEVLLSKVYLNLTMKYVSITT